MAAQDSAVELKKAAAAELSAAKEKLTAVGTSTRGHF